MCNMQTCIKAQFWARARAGKRGGDSELHATLIKAAVKKVFMQTGPDGKSRKVAYTGHVVRGLRQLVNAARGGSSTVTGHGSRCTPSSRCQEQWGWRIRDQWASWRYCRRHLMALAMQQSRKCGRGRGCCTIRSMHSGQSRGQKGHYCCGA